MWASLLGVKGTFLVARSSRSVTLAELLRAAETVVCASGALRPPCGQGREPREPSPREPREPREGAEGAEGAEQGADREGELRCKGARGPEAEPVADERPVAAPCSAAQSGLPINCFSSQLCLMY